MADGFNKTMTALRTRGWKLTTAESCTGGLIAATITDMAGASDVFERGFVTYSNQAKQDLLNVSPQTLSCHGAVSHETAAAMADGALRNSCADVAVSVTGIAGPDGGTPTKPVGLVYIGLVAYNIPPQTYEHHFSGDRANVRAQSVAAAFIHLASFLQGASSL